MARLPIRTKRLILDSLKEEDKHGLFEYRSSSDVTKYQSWKPNDVDDALQFIQEYSFNGETKIGNWHQLGIYLLKNDKLIGDCGFKLLDENQAEIGYTIAPAYRNRGFGFEAIQNLLNFLFVELRLLKVIARTGIKNDKSIRLLRKLDFKKENNITVEIVELDQDEVVFSLSKPESFR
jgi:RimJ/RimL family protein N-acetyltransferase